MNDDVRKYNIGNSDYSKYKIQPWDIWLEYNLNPWDADIIKRVLRSKGESGISQDESRIMDYDKIIHICNERKRQLTKSSIKLENDKDLCISKNKIIIHSLFDEQCDKYVAFCKEHSKCVIPTAIGGHINIIFTATSVGLGVKFECTACGELMNVTNYENW